MKQPAFVFRHCPIRLLLGAAAIASALPASAEVRLPRYFTDNMMLQRDQPVRVWGWADAGETVSVEFAGKSASTKADADGEWKLELPAIASGENLDLSVKGQNTLTLKNLILGDIWICSGQSNMEMSLGGCLGDAGDIQSANLPKIRRIKFNHEQAGQPSPEAPTATPWQVCSPETVAGFTAVGYYFAREVHQKTGVPIGLVDSNWGGTAIEPWVAMEGLGLVDALEPALAARQAEIKAFQGALTASLPELEKWLARTRKNLAEGAATTPPPRLPDGIGSYSGMYNAMIHPVVPAPIKGALWYQGESNGGEGTSYFHKMSALIGGWRKQWGLGDFPFYFVQLASFQDPIEDPAGGNGWARLREAQLQSLALPHTGMAVITDTVPLAERGDIHPRNKFDVGSRLAQWALAKDYGQTSVVCSGPLFKAMTIREGKARLEFDHTGSGLMVGKKEGRSPAVEDAQGKLKRFAIAGADQKWHWADAVIEPGAVVVSSPAVKDPVAVRYAFEMNPDGANLYNREGLPASPFRTDAW
jgi:sialate O-acetylesterase